jgi:hypothetical protein
MEMDGEGMWFQGKKIFRKGYVDGGNGEVEKLIFAG